MQDEESEVRILKIIRVASIWILLKIKRNGKNGICQRKVLKKLPRTVVPFKIESMEMGGKDTYRDKIQEISKFWNKGGPKTLPGRKKKQTIYKE